MASASGRRRAWLLAVPILLLGLAAAVTVAGPAPGTGAVYLPSTDDELLETLPARSNRRETAISSASQPATLDEATAVAHARAELTQYQESSDPRHLGRAEAALGRYWDEPDPPEPVLVLRARIQQSNHEFAAALADLDRALRAEPSDAQALLDRASVETVIGRYDAARRDCDEVVGLAAPLYSSVCRAAVAGATGSAQGAIADLTRTLAVSRPEREGRCWAESLLGELSARVADYAAAESYFLRVHAACPLDSYVKGALADLWLDQGRNAEVVRLLSDQGRHDALLLRLAIAEKRLGAPAFAAHLSDLSERFEEAHLRGSSVHRREEARFQLELRNAPERALSLSLDNFQVQREAADVRIALESALAAGKLAHAGEVVAFARSSGLEDPQLSRLLSRFPP